MCDEPAAASTPHGLIDRAKLSVIAVDRTHTSMIVTDPNQPDNPIILANRAFINLVGYPAEEIIGRNCRFMQGPETAADDVRVIRDAIAQRIDVTHEVLNYRRNGEAFWNEIHVSPVFDDSGNLIYFFGSHTDVSARRRATDLERAEQVLLREIEHRAKNALALVQGIVRLSRSDDTERYARSVQGRVNALASAHMLLAGGKWRAVPLETVVRAELTAVREDRVNLAGPSITIDSPHVQPLVLVLHEIVANAIEHGSLSSYPSGQGRGR